MNAKGGIISSAGHTGVTTQIADPSAQPSENWLANGCAGPCMIRDILDRIGDKWSVLVILRLGSQPERFRALLRAVDGISARMLTVTLRGLERDGLVAREVFATRPPSVQYSLTLLGETLLGHIGALAGWAVANEAQIKLAQLDFDQQIPPG